MISKRVRKVGLLLLLSLLMLAVTACGKPKATEGLVASVNGMDITIEEFETDFEVYKMISKQQYGEDAMEQVGSDGKTLEEMIRTDVIEKLIMEKIIEDEAKEKGIVVTAEDVREPLEGYIEMLGGEDQYDEFLEANSISKEYFEENIRKELVYNKHRDYFMENTKVEDKEVKKYFDEHKDELAKVKVKHILLKTEEEGQEALDRLNQGEDFDKLAHELSADKTSGELGGDLGYFSKGDFIAEFEDAAFSLEVGETSDLVKTEVGYHIIYLEDKLEDYESLEDTIANMIKESKYYEKIENLRENAKVKIF